jgi:hypothetical protein
MAVSEPSSGPVPYRVIYSEWVRKELKALAARAKARGLSGQFQDALRELDRRLHTYPQFGQPLRDLKLKPAQLWIGVVEPLVVQYWLNDEMRLVIVGAPIQTLPHSGF